MQSITIAIPAATTWADQPEGTLAALFRDWRAIPSSLGPILQLAGFEESTTGIKAPGARAAAAPARWLDDAWTQDDLAGPLDRPRLYWVRRLEVTGPAGTAIGRILR